MACININTKEYKTLLEKYKDRLVVDSLITSYQQSSKTDVIPSIEEVEELIDDRKTYFSLEKKNFEKSLFGNLAKKKLITKFNGEFYVVNTVPGEYTGGIDRAKYNMLLARNYLLHHGFENYLRFEPTKNGKTFRVLFEDGLFNPKDIIAESPYSNKNYKDQTNILQLVDSIVEKFPGVDVQVMRPSQAEYFLNLLPKEARPTKLNFKKVKSFYYDGQVILIKGRVTKDTAVEEVLHPFIESLYLGSVVSFAVKASPLNPVCADIRFLVCLFVKSICLLIISKSSFCRAPLAFIIAFSASILSFANSKSAIAASTFNLASCPASRSVVPLVI